MDPSRQPTGTQHVHFYTDLYDRERGTFLVRFPMTLVAGMGLWGAVAMFLTGFTGYTGEGFPSDLFLQPWPLYLWFCALALILEVSVLRHPAVRAQLVVTLLWSLLTMVLVGIV